MSGSRSQRQLHCGPDLTLRDEAICARSLHDVNAAADGLVDGNEKRALRPVFSYFLAVEGVGGEPVSVQEQGIFVLRAL
jgi:hypothetical protein